MTDLGFLLAARPHLSLAAHEPGLVTLHFDFGVLLDVPELAEPATQALLQRLPGVISFDVHAFRRRIAIAYDPERIPPDWWDTLIDGSDADARAVAERLARSLDDA